MKQHGRDSTFKSNTWKLECSVNLCEVLLNYSCCHICMRLKIAFPKEGNHWRAFNSIFFQKSWLTGYSQAGKNDSACWHFPPKCQRGLVVCAPVLTWLLPVGQKVLHFAPFQFATCQGLRSPVGGSVIWSNFCETTLKNNISTPLPSRKKDLLSRKTPQSCTRPPGRTSIPGSTRRLAMLRGRHAKGRSAPAPSLGISKRKTGISRIQGHC